MKSQYEAACEALGLDPRTLKALPEDLAAYVKQANIATHGGPSVEHQQAEKRNQALTEVLQGAALGKIEAERADLERRKRQIDAKEAELATISFEWDRLCEQGPGIKKGIDHARYLLQGANGAIAGLTEQLRWQYEASHHQVHLNEISGVLMHHWQLSAAKTAIKDLEAFIQEREEALEAHYEGMVAFAKKNNIPRECWGFLEK